MPAVRALHARIRISAQERQDQDRRKARNESADARTHSGLARFFLGPSGRILDRRVCPVRDPGHGRVHVLLSQVFAADRRKAAGRAVRQYRQDLRRAGNGGGGRPRHSCRNRGSTCAAADTTRSRGNPMGYYQPTAGCHRDLPRAGIVFRPGSRRHQVRRRQDLADHLPAATIRRAASTSWSRS